MQEKLSGCSDWLFKFILKKIFYRNNLGKQCIVVEPTSKIAEISEILCIGCGICVKVC